MFLVNYASGEISGYFLIKLSGHTAHHETKWSIIIDYLFSDYSPKSKVLTAQEVLIAHCEVQCRNETLMRSEGRLLRYYSIFKKNLDLYLYKEFNY